MSREKLKFRLYTVLFCVAIFILTVMGLVVLYYKALFPPLLLFMLVYIAAWAFVFAFAVDFFISDGKFSGRKIILLTFGVIILSTTVTHSVWTIVTPKWSFSVSTDKSTYRLGENVQITVSLENIGFITHSFESAISEPVLISIQVVHTTGSTWDVDEVWFGPYPFHSTRTEFVIPSGQSLVRTFIWNQTITNISYLSYRREIEPGEYRIEAVIPSAHHGVMYDPVFSAVARMNISSV